MSFGALRSRGAGDPQGPGLSTGIHPAAGTPASSRIGTLVAFWAVVAPLKPSDAGRSPGPHGAGGPWCRWYSRLRPPAARQCGGGGPRAACYPGSEHNPDNNVMLFTSNEFTEVRLQMCELLVM